MFVEKGLCMFFKKECDFVYVCLTNVIKGKCRERVFCCNIFFFAALPFKQNKIQLNLNCETIVYKPKCLFRDLS